MLNALILTFLAGFATFIGGLLSLSIKKDNKIISFLLALSAGVMIYISFMELLPSGIVELSKISSSGKTLALISFFSGMIIYFLIDRMIPDNSHEGHSHNSFKKLSLTTVLAVTIHNFPEGMTVFSVSMENNLNLALNLILAISMHNIPEGIIVATSIYLATNSKKKALWGSFLSGLAEPIGGLIGYYSFNAAFHQYSTGLMFSFISGMMIFLSLEQLLPEARKLHDSHLISYGVIVGMILMALTV
jgi:ZIP family zinc transporter